MSNCKMDRRGSLQAGVRACWGLAGRRDDRAGFRRCQGRDPQGQGEDRDPGLSRRRHDAH